MTNGDIARKLRERAAELAKSGDNLYRIRAFRQAAVTLMGMPEDVQGLVASGGSRAIERIPGIGKSLSEMIATIAAN